MPRIAQFLLLASIISVAPSSRGATQGGTDVVTYHYDALRTGWNSTETTLTPTNVASNGFGLLAQVALDEQVDAQPLFLSNLQIAGGAHDVIYVATENNTLYAIDADNGAVLAQNTLGPAVPRSHLLDECSNNSDYVGINSTPVIDRAANALYVITYTLESNKPTFRLHAVDLATLADKMPSTVIGGSGRLTNGKTYEFVAAHNRQRAALLETNGNIYAGFASWCDLGANLTRGWVMGWNAATLAPLATDKLLNQKAKTPNRFYLTDIWMSGYGIASDGKALYFSTGNSDPAGKSYDPAANLEESVVRMSTDLTTVQDYFTPQGGQYGWSNLDRADADFSGAGVMLLPDQRGPVPHLAVAAGKYGPMYLLDRDHMGGLGSEKVTLGQYLNYGCWCGPSYFVGADGIGRVVESSGVVAVVWKVKTSPKPKLVAESFSPHLQNMQDPGFFTTISSNGTIAGTPIIWAVQRPFDPNTNQVSLVAFDPTQGSAQIFSGVAGTWPFAESANANIVPVVANGRVFVASYKNLSGFGLYGTGAKRMTFRAPPPPPARGLPAGVAHEVRGLVTKLEGNSMQIRLRDGRILAVDMAKARAGYHVAQPSVGHASDVRGDYAGGVFVASSVLHQKDNVLTWAADR